MAEAELREEVSPEASLLAPQGKGGQKYLSSLIDAKLRTGIEAGPGADGAYRQHLALVRIPGAGAWLTAPPVEGRKMDASLFRIALARRLRLRLSDDSTWCPLCSEIMDPFGDHAVACACAGDRTVRHNRFRNIFWEESRAAGLPTDKEKANLLPDRPSEEGIRPTTGKKAPGRRPADVFWKGGVPICGDIGVNGVAWDFAVTSGLRADKLTDQGADVERIFREYEHWKKQYKNTAEHCKSEGFAFEPLIIEAHGGGWSGTLRKVVDNIARRQDATSSGGAEPASLRIAQRLSICLQAENARAILKRLAHREVETTEEEAEWDWEAAEGAQVEEDDEEEEEEGEVEVEGD